MHLVFYNAVKFFCKIACKYALEPIDIHEAWLSAEKLYFYTYGRKLFANKEFSKLISKIKWFVKEFTEISKDKVKDFRFFKTWF